MEMNGSSPTVVVSLYYYYYYYYLSWRDLQFTYVLLGFTTIILKGKEGLK